MRFQVGKMTDRLERWLSFLSRRWTEPTTRAGEPCTEKRSGYVRGSREGGWEEGREVDEVRVLAETMAKFGKLTAFFVAVSLVSLLFSSTEPGFGRNTSSMLLLTPDRELFLLGNDRGHLAA